jgi:hypothetical protein
MRFEWAGSAAAPGAPERRRWKVCLLAGGALAWRCDDAVAMGAPGDLAARLGASGVTMPDGLVVCVAWSQRADGRSVELNVSDDSGASNLRVRFGSL